MKLFENTLRGGLRVFSAAIALLLALTGITMTTPRKAVAASKQPTDINVRCGTQIDKYYSGGYAATSKNTDCTIIVTFDDWSTDVAHYNGEKLTGDASQIQLGGGFKATTGCTTPVSVTTDIKDNYSLQGAYSYCLTAGLKSKPVSQTPATASIAQVPVTGAPASDMVLPAVIVAGSVLGVGFMMSRRRLV